MILTDRDFKLVRDIGLSHLLSRDQILSLRYFGSVTRANTRLRALVAEGFVRPLDTPFHLQRLYMAGKQASAIVGGSVSRVLEARVGSPRFIQHALTVTNCRIALLARGAKDWRFEQQLWRKISPQIEVRPDGLALTSQLPMFIEVDLGHVAPAKFKSKLLSYEFLMNSGQCERLFGFPTFRLLTVTTGERRAKSLSKLHTSGSFEHLVQTLEALAIPKVGAWS